MTVNTASLFLAQITKESQRERSVHLSVPSATQPSQNLPIPPDCVLIQSQETLWPLRAALLWGNTHARRAHVQGPTLLHNTPATTYQPKITQIHTCYCLVIDIVLIGKKAHSSRDLWSFNVRLQKPGSAFRNHDVAAMLLNHLFKASSTQESTLLLAFFLLFLSKAVQRHWEDAFQREGIGSVAGNGPSHLRRRWGICSRDQNNQRWRERSTFSSLKPTRSPVRFLLLPACVWTHQLLICCVRVNGANQELDHFGHAEKHLFFYRQAKGKHYSDWCKCD